MHHVHSIHVTSGPSILSLSFEPGGGKKLNGKTNLKCVHFSKKVSSTQEVDTGHVAPMIMPCPGSHVKLSYLPSFNTSCLGAHVGFFRWLMKGIFGPYVL